MARIDFHSDSECLGLWASNPRMRSQPSGSSKCGLKTTSRAARLPHEALSLGGSMQPWWMWTCLVCSVLAQIHNFEPSLQTRCHCNLGPSLEAMWVFSFILAKLEEASLWKTLCPKATCWQKVPFRAWHLEQSWPQWTEGHLWLPKGCGPCRDVSLVEVGRAGASRRSLEWESACPEAPNFCALLFCLRRAELWPAR